MSKFDEVSLLGHTVRDVVTERVGVVVSVSYDLSGCVQGYVVPKVNKDGKIEDGWWVDTKRLEVRSKGPAQLRQAPALKRVAGGTALPAHAEKGAP